MSLGTGSALASEPAASIVKGRVSMSASIDWNPPTPFTLKVEPLEPQIDSDSIDILWVSPAKRRLERQLYRAAQSGRTVVLRGHHIVKDNQVVFVLDHLMPYRKKAKTPSWQDCETAQRTLLSLYGWNGMKLSNGGGIRHSTDGDCAVALYFPTQNNLDTYNDHRCRSGRRRDYLEMRSRNDGRLVRIRIYRQVIGNIGIQPLVGVSN